MGGDPVSVGPDPGPDEQHGRAGGAEDVGQQGAGGQEEHVGRGSCFSLDADVDAAGHDEEGAYQCDEADIFTGGVEHARGCLQREYVVQDDECGEAKADSWIIFSPPFREEEWRERNGGKERTDCLLYTSPSPRDRT